MHRASSSRSRGWRSPSRETSSSSVRRDRERVAAGQGDPTLERVWRRPLRATRTLLALEDIALELALEDDVLELGSVRVPSLYGGTGSAAAPPPSWRVGEGVAAERELDVSLHDVDIAPLLHNLFDYTHATGRGSLSARLAAHGAIPAPERLADARMERARSRAHDGTLVGAVQLALQAVADGGTAARFRRVAGKLHACATAWSRATTSSSRARTGRARGEAAPTISPAATRARSGGAPQRRRVSGEATRSPGTL